MNCKGTINKSCNVLQMFQLAHRHLFILFPKELNERLDSPRVMYVSAIAQSSTVLKVDVFA